MYIFSVIDLSVSSEIQVPDNRWLTLIPGPIGLLENSVGEEGDSTLRETVHGNEKNIKI